MDINRIETLVEKYLEALTTIEEERELIAFFKKGPVPEHLQKFREKILYFERVKKQTYAEPLPAFKERRPVKWPYRKTIAAVAATLLIFLSGFFLGRVKRPDADLEERLQTVETKLIERKKTEALKLIHQSSPNQRLVAIDMLNDVPTVDSLLLNALIRTFSEDPNDNVRLAALNILYLHIEDTSVQNFLLKELYQQRSVIILSSLVDVLSDINEKRVINTLNRYSQHERAPKVIRKKIRQKLKSGLQ